MKTYLLPILCTCAAIGVGLSLPWMVFAHQDRTAQEQVLRYDAPEIRLANEKAALFPRLALAANLDTLLPLHGPSSQRTAEDALHLALNAMDLLADLGLSSFAPDRWTPDRADRSLLTSTGDTVIQKSTQDGWSMVETFSDAAIVWACQFTTQEGEELVFLVDDDLGLVLSFAYHAPAKSDMLSRGLTEETVLLLTEFCRSYYSVDIQSPVADSDGGWFLPLWNDAKETHAIPLAADQRGFFFNQFPD